MSKPIVRGFESRNIRLESSFILFPGVKISFMWVEPSVSSLNFVMVIHCI